MTVVTAEVTRLGAQGDGIVERAEGEIFVPYALPGDQVAVAEDGSAEIVAFGSSPRAAPFCRHFGTCGGCVSQHMPPDVYRKWKCAGLIGAFRARGIDVNVTEWTAMPLASRRRATFTAQRVRDETGRFQVKLGYHGRKSHSLVDIVECGVARPKIATALAGLKALVALLPEGLQDARIFVAEVAEGLDVDIMPEADAKALDAPRRERMAHHAQALGIVRLTLGRELVMTSTTPHLVSGRARIPLPRAAFFQASAEAERQMIDAMLAAIGKKRVKRVVDLFSGVGPFTLAAATIASVKAVDSDQSALTSLMHAARATPGLKPIETLRRDLFRDPLGVIELNAFDAAILDPPRAGAEMQARMLAKSKVSKIAYVSCNPATLARDARVLIDGGFKLTHVTPIDQFVHSAHLEAVAAFAR